MLTNVLVSDKIYERFDFTKYLFSYTNHQSAMGVDLPDYILHYNGKPMPPNIGNYREKMQKNGRKK